MEYTGRKITSAWEGLHPGNVPRKRNSMGKSEVS